MREPGVEDATRRTRLANERTYLAWWRTGLTSFAVSVGVGRLVPEHTTATRWPFETVGAAFGLLGIAFVAAGFARARAVERALDRGTFAQFGETQAALLLAAGVLLGVAVVVLVLLG